MPFQKGNPYRFEKGHESKGGRPEGAISINDELRKLLATKDKKTGKLYVESLALKIFTDALKGNDRLLIELWQQIEGRAKQQIDVGGQADNPIQSTLTILNASQAINNKPKQVDEDD